MMSKTLLAVLNEKDVENYYRQYLTKKFGDIVFNSPVKCDGYGESKKHGIRLLCEFKDNLDLTLRINQVKVLAQAVYYIKKFEIAGKVLPSVIFVGDRDECFAIHTNDVFKYLSMELDWSIAPSNAHTNVELVNELMSDKNINPFVFNVEDVDKCVEKIKELTEGVKRLIPITPHNITEVFKHFEEKVLGKHNLTTNQLANLFVQILINPSDNFYHPKKKNVLYTKSHGDIQLKSTQAFISFFSHFASEYSPKQKEHLTAVVDRLVQDVTRRKQGEFFTPTIWVDKAHEYIASVFGEDWKDKYVVWDPAWGTGNLTRDYKFKELYVSTLVYADIETANQMGYNPEAVKFQYDFLNDPYEYLPAGLRKAIESGRQIIVLMNPPYATSTDMRNTSNEETLHKSGTSSTKIYTEMMSEGLGKGSEQLYSQFIYRIAKYKTASIAMFTKPLFISGPTFHEFRKKTLSEFKFEKGFLMDSVHFADVKSWGLSFTILSKSKDENPFNYDILDNDGINGIVNKGLKTIYNTDNKIALSEWVRKEIKSNKHFAKILRPHLSSGLKPSDKEVVREFEQNYLGSYVGLGNNIQRNDRGVTLLSSTGVQGNACVSLSIIPDNFFKIISTFSSRKLIEPNWVNEKDEYLCPNEINENYTQYSVNSLIYCLFNNSSEQSGLRQITYKNQLWDIKNQFFWMSKEEMMNLANQNNYTELYNDARTDSDRYVHNLLFGEQRIYDQLSTEAKNVLDAATELIRLSIEMRRNFADDHNHLNSWDAGYVQLKLLWKEYFPEQFKEFRNKYKVLEDKMRPMVYELGFLKK